MEITHTLVSEKCRTGKAEQETLMSKTVEVL